MMKMLFVCLGNICRSPMAEAVMKDKLANSSLADKVTVASGATSRWEEGNPPHPGTQKILNMHNISFTDIYSTPITVQDFEHYDLLIGMDKSNVEDMKRMAPTDTLEKIHLFMEQVAGKETEEVPDPYYTGDFEQTYQMVDEGTDAWLAYLNKLAR
ncbi:low molecular weight phosphotyrosine protein phosphatase [Erwinia sp. CPCC 100877]|nr:low molecular weight phosphotyrosine protein phosphatase [Erwinia sp. CPCC 100877]